ncbi:hypothetical protein ABPG73_006980 [Tetrahymena malaccensis]
MNSELQQDLAQTLMRQLISTYQSIQPSTYDKIIHKLRFFNPLKISKNRKFGPIILASVNLLIHYLKHKQLISAQNFRKFFTLNVRNLNEKRFINLISYAFTHISLPHLLSNILLFYGYSDNISKLLGIKKMFLIYLVGALIGGMVLYWQQKKSRDQSNFNGSNAGYTALAGYTAILLQNYNRQMIGINIPAWFECLISVLLCISQQSNDFKNKGVIEVTGFLTGILLYYIQQFIPQKQYHRRELVINVV